MAEIICLVSSKQTAMASMKILFLVLMGQWFNLNVCIMIIVITFKQNLVVENLTFLNIQYTLFNQDSLHSSSTLYNVHYTHTANTVYIKCFGPARVNIDTIKG